MKVFYNGDFREINKDTKVFVGRVGGCRHTVFGEHGHLVKATSTQLIFETESGTIVKTSRDNLHNVYGKAKKADYFVSLVTRDAESYLHEEVSYWNADKRCFENK